MSGSPLATSLPFMQQTIQVYEHEVLRVGDQRNGVTFDSRHHEALAAFAEWHSTKYFRLVHRGVRFAQYVGALQVGSLTIEILPKTDRATPNEHPVLQSVLLDLLRACRILKPAPNATGRLRSRRGTLLDIYLEQMLADTERLMHQGLLRTYRVAARNRPTLKGQIHFPKHLQLNLTREDRFFTRCPEFTYDHSYNRILRQALVILGAMPLRPDLQSKVRRLLHFFPELPPPPSLPEIAQLQFDRQTQAYQSPLQTALLILRHQQPDVRSGRLPVLALLFDMNVLFEEFVFRQIQRATGKNVAAHRQMRRSFWDQRYLQPDILLYIGDERIVLDTKWKLLRRVQPDMADLRQMYVYNQFFEARRSVLVYPRVEGLEDLPPTPFAPTAGASGDSLCQVVFVDLVNNGKLNHELGKELLNNL